jgi:hypothetical protein
MPVDGTINIVDPNNLSAPNRWNLGASHATKNLFVTGADDVVFHDGWLDAAVRGMTQIGGHGIVAFNDLSPMAGKLATHYMISRGYAIADFGGVMAIPVYQHTFMDTEASARASRDGVLAYAEDAVVEHLHPFWDKAEQDEYYEKAYSPDGGKELYEQRSEMGFPNTWEPCIFWPKHEPGHETVAVAPRIFRSPDRGFFISWTNMLLFGLNAGDYVVMPSEGGEPGHIAANIAIQKFLRSGRDALLFIDDDMEFGHDALHQLRADLFGSEYGIMMGFCTHRTWPPHAVVVRKSPEPRGLPSSLAGQDYVTLAVDERYDNSIIEVDAVGLAFTLIRREVLEALTNEFGATHTYDYVQWGTGYEGEDVTFSRRAKERGTRLAVNTSVKIDHVGRVTFGWSAHQQWLADRGQSE